MSEQRIRDVIARTTNPNQKNVLKVVLGEFQQKNAGGKATDADLVKIAEKIVEGNKETLGYLKEGDPRIAVLNDENAIVAEFIPKYLGVDDVLPLVPADVQAQVKAAGNDGQATGVLSKWAKAGNHSVKGDVLKQVVGKIRSA